MDCEFLRKDEVWFVERRTGEGPRLYPLDAFGDVKMETSVEKRISRDGRPVHAHICPVYRRVLLCIFGLG